MKLNLFFPTAKNKVPESCFNSGIDRTHLPRSIKISSFNIG